MICFTFNSAVILLFHGDLVAYVDVFQAVCQICDCLKYCPGQHFTYSLNFFLSKKLRELLKGTLFMTPVLLLTAEEQYCMMHMCCSCLDRPLSILYCIQVVSCIVTLCISLSVDFELLLPLQWQYLFSTCITEIIILNNLYVNLLQFGFNFILAL